MFRAPIVRHLRRSAMLATAFAVCVVSGVVVQSRSGGVDASPVGFTPGRGYFSQFPFENIDMVNGNLLLTFTDIVLPGDAGMDLRISRSYNHQSGFGWKFGFSGVPTYVTHPNGRLPGEGGSQVEVLPVFLTADGGGHTAFPVNGLNNVGDEFVTKEFWRYRISSHTLELPNGWRAIYESDTSLAVAMLQEVIDPFGNRLTPEWEPGLVRPFRLNAVTQSFGSGQRTVRFHYGHWIGDGLVTRVSVDGAPLEWRYDYTELPTGTAVMTSARPVVGPGPAFGPGWTYGYVNRTQVLVTTPNGGTVTYDFDEITSSEAPPRYPIIRRRTGGRDIPVEEWTFSTLLPDSGWDGPPAIVNLPYGRSIEYYLAEFSWSNCNIADSWQKLGRKVLKSGGTVLADSRQYYTYLPIATQCSTMALAETTLEQDGRFFRTTFGYSPWDFGDYHRPNQVTEQGELTRFTSRTYRHNFGVYILGRVASESVTVNGETFSSSFDYDNEGFMWRATRLGITTTAGRDGAGNRTSVTDANGRTTTFTYQNGALQNTNAPLTSQNRWIDHVGNVVTTSQGGLTTDFEYDYAGRLKQTSYPGQGREPVWTNYDDGGGAWVQTCRAAACTTTTVDGYGRPRTTTDPSGVQTTVEYDVFGRKTLQTRPGSGLADRFYYDGLDRLIRILHPDNYDVWYAYNGQVLSVTDEAGRTTHQHMPAFGNPGDARLASVTDPAGNQWLYSYNAVGSLTRVDAPGVNPDRTWQYNSRNELEIESHPESGTTVYGYDAAGNLTYKRDARNTEFRFTYDANNRLTLIDVGDWVHNTSIAYDGLDRKTEIVRGLNSISYAYDAGGRLQHRGEAIDYFFGFGTWYSYDAEDRLTQITYPSGRQVYYSYNPAGRVTKVEATDGAWFTVADNFQYHSSGALVGYTRGNGTTEAVTLDPWTSRVTQLVSGPLNQSYAYDAVGNMTGITDVRAGFSSTFTYDVLDRLINVTGFGAKAFTYDALGNRLSKSYAPNNTVTYSYNWWQQLGSASGAQEDATFTYDAVGNQLTDATPAGQATYTYTPFNQMATATVGSAASEYAYNGENQRKRRQTPSGLTYTVHGAGGQILAEYDKVAFTPPTWQRDYVYLGSKLLLSIGNSTATPPTQIKAYYHTDLLGSVRAVTDATGNLTTATRRDYDAFGVEHAQPQHPQAPLSGERQRFAGKQLDPETYLQYFEARYYDGGLGRFTSVDPVIPAWARTRPQGWNRYAYALNNPLKFVDPSGLTPESVPLPVPSGGSDMPQELCGAPNLTPSEEGYDSFWGQGVLGRPFGVLDGGGLPYARATGPIRVAPEYQGRGGLSIDLTDPFFYIDLLPWGRGVKGAAFLAGALKGLSAGGRAALAVTERGLAHVLARHVTGGALTAGKSVFYGGAKEVRQLIDAAGRVSPTQQPGGRLGWIVDAGRDIGIDRTTGLPTSQYTVISDHVGALITAFPGVPGR